MISSSQKMAIVAKRETKRFPPQGWSAFQKIRKRKVSWPPWQVAMQNKNGQIHKGFSFSLNKQKEFTSIKSANTSAYTKDAMAQYLGGGGEKFKLSPE